MRLLGEILDDNPNIGGTPDRTIPTQEKELPLLCETEDRATL